MTNTLPAPMLLTANDVLRLSGYKSRSSLYRLIRQNRCPAPVSIGGSQIRWRAQDIEVWLGGLPQRVY